MKKTLIIATVLIILFLVFTIFSIIFKKPSNDRNWWESLSILPYAEIDGEKLSIDSIRNWEYDKNGPIKKEWISEDYDLNKLKGAWFFVVPFSDWKGLAHTMISFEFEDKDPLVISIEARKEIGEDYKLISGLKNEFEIIYIWGTEKDLLGDRALVRENTIYMYPLDININFAKKLLINMLEETNEIYENPRFYNTLINNCTNELALAANEVQKGTVPMSFARIFPGYSFDLLFKLNYIKDEEESKDILKEKYNATEAIKKYINDYDFSKLIRDNFTKVN